MRAGTVRTRDWMRFVRMEGVIGHADEPEDNGKGTEMMGKRMWLVVGLLAVLALAIAGCGQQITAEEIVQHVQETVANTQDAHAVISASLSAQGIDLSATAEVWEKSPTKLRAEVLESSQAEYDGAVLVTDGEQAWYYSPDRNVVMVGPMDKIETPLPQQMIGEMQDIIQAVLDASDVELDGEETVAGRSAYKLILTPREASEGEEAMVLPGNGTTTLWVDKDQWFVLKATYEAGSLGQGTMEVQSFELNPGLADDLFIFEPPEGATVVDVASQAPVPLTLEEARAQADFLLVPAYVPQGATLVEVFKMGGSFILRYDHSPDVAFTVVQGSEPAGPPVGGQSQGITVRGQSAAVVTDEAGGNTFLYWIEDGIFMTVAGHLPLDEAVQVAESLQ
jgi:outer membrane lipoprotein-sorting protein